MEEKSKPKPVNAEGGNVLVVNRTRPLNKMEIGKGAKCCLEWTPNGKGI